MESKKRTVYKTISWRIIATAILFIISFIATGSLPIAGTLIGMDIIVKTILYYLHERVWSKVKDE